MWRNGWPPIPTRRSDPAAGVSARLEWSLAEVPDTLFRSAVHLAMLALLALLGAGAVFYAWAALNMLLWQPFWRELRAFGFYTHDVEGAFLITLGPPVVGGLYLVGGVIEAVIAARSPVASLSRAVVLFGGMPMIVCAVASHLSHGWGYPLSGTAVVIVGTVLGLIYHQFCLREAIAD